MCISNYTEYAQHGTIMEHELVKQASYKKYKMLTLHSGDHDVITEMIEGGSQSNRRMLVAPELIVRNSVKRIREKRGNSGTERREVRS